MIAPVDYTLVYTIAASTIAIVGTLIAMMFWVRSEANTLRAEAKEDRKDLIEIGRNLHLTTIVIQQEIKDFHSRLYTIEKNKK
jgi:hypothetical protein